MASATQAKWTFAIPGDPTTPTGGYIYDARVIEASAGALNLLRLPGGFPRPTALELSQTRDSLMTAGPCLIDGLAFGALPVEMVTSLPHSPVVLCHHPLGLETGLNEAESAQLIAGERANLGLAHRVIVTSDATKRTLLDLFGLNDSKVTVAPPGLDRAPPAQGNEPPVLLTVASLTQRKAHDVLVKALAKVSDLNWRAVWVGPDDRDLMWAAHIRDLAKSEGLAKRIEILGAVDAPTLAKAYLGANIFVLPSRYEGYGMVFDEAMMRALPVIACAAGAAPDVVPQNAGTLVPVDDAAALADAIAEMLADQTKRAQMSAEGRRHALTLPSWNDTWATIKTVLEAHE